MIMDQDLRIKLFDKKNKSLATDSGWYLQTDLIPKSFITALVYRVTNNFAKKTGIGRSFQAQRKMLITVNVIK